MWDERYNTQQYAYGKEPNDFLAQQYKELPKGRVISWPKARGEMRYF